ncbi:unnamed protein product [Caenorhabditis angaria]|uniref:Phospholipase A(2) n=1 Tax=Caenorhabditis angaria TaxID=860376 RepID=A0A9P1MV48_9PELO|nr:unnamed protein product [Caenorhabditis angaria]
MVSSQHFCILFLFLTLPAVIYSINRPKIVKITTTQATTTTTGEPRKLPEVLLNATWECGTDEFTKSISEGEILGKCPKLRDQFNSCCYAHDQCYVDQSGQKFCDDNFCDCLERRSRSSKLCHDESSPIFCSLVKSFGDGAYEASAPNATTTDEGLIETDDYDYESNVRNGTKLFD